VDFKPLPLFFVDRMIDGATWPIHGYRQFIRISPMTLSSSTFAYVHFCRFILHPAVAILMSAIALERLRCMLQDNAVMLCEIIFMRYKWLFCSALVFILSVLFINLLYMQPGSVEVLREIFFMCKMYKENLKLFSHP